MPTQRTTNSNTPAIASSGTALAANSARIGFMIQNLGTNVLFVRFGAGASTSLFHIALKGGSGNDDGAGAILLINSGTVYTGEISIAGTSPRYTVLEMAP